MSVLFLVKGVGVHLSSCKFLDSWSKIFGLSVKCGFLNFHWKSCQLLQLEGTTLHTCSWSSCHLDVVPVPRSATKMLSYQDKADNRSSSRSL